MGFKEALSSDHLPSVMFNSIRTSPLCFSRSWQFSTLQSMLGGKFVITFQGSTLFVLDSMNGVVVGAAILKHNIKSVSISGGSLYILTSAVSKAAIVRVGVHYSYVTVENEPRKLLSAWSTPSTSVNNSPMGSLENLVDPETVTVGHASCEKHEQLSDEKSQADNSDAVTEQPDRGVPTLYLSEPCSGDTATLLEADGKYESAVLPNIFQQDLDQGTNQHEPLHPSQSEKEHQVSSIIMLHCKLTTIYFYRILHLLSEKKECRTLQVNGRVPIFSWLIQENTPGVFVCHKQLVMTLLLVARVSTNGKKRPKGKNCPQQQVSY